MEKQPFDKSNKSSLESREKYEKLFLAVELVSVAYWDMTRRADTTACVNTLLTKAVEMIRDPKRDIHAAGIINLKEILKTIDEKVRTIRVVLPGNEHMFRYLKEIASEEPVLNFKSDMSDKDERSVLYQSLLKHLRDFDRVNTGHFFYDVKDG